MSIEKLVFLFSLGIFAGCTGAVAPTNEGGGTTAVKDTTSGGTTGGTTGGKTGAATDDTSDDTSGDDDGADDGGEGGDSALGMITAETTDIATFVGKSTYMVNTAASGSNSLMVADYVVANTLFKKIASYGPCEKLPETTTTTAKQRFITVSFSKTYDPSATEHKVDDNGFPKENNNTIADPAVVTAGVSGTFYDSANATEVITVKTGTVNFSSKPAAVKDTYTVVVDLVLSNGKKYKATLEGVTDTYPTNPTAPTCPTGQYAPAKYD